MRVMDKVLIILACTLAFLLIASLGAVILSERFMTGGTGALGVILGTASTVLTAVAGGAYYARGVERSVKEEGEQIEHEGSTKKKATLEGKNGW
jgi:hypothetical protein